MDEIQKDERFAHTLTDPRFRRPHIKQRKIKIDSRFKSMLKDKEFSTKVTVDKRGRPIASSTKENLGRLYDYESEEEEDDSSGEEDSQNQEEKEQEDSSEEKDSQEEEEEDGADAGSDDEKETASESESEEEDPIKITEDGPDYARGGGTIESSDEDDDDDDDDFDPENKLDSILDHNWNEPDRAAPEADEISRRLALCNMDWDRIKARDIYVLLNSFVPQGGALRSVNIYISQIGREKMAEEDKLGPREFREGDAEEENNDMGELNRAKLRQYQLNRLKYFFAIIECDSKETANSIYEECDSIEYEKSACRIDLRFVPDGMTFDETLKESCTGISDMASFEPSTFTSTAFCQAKVQVTWDETNIDRLKKTMRKYTEEELDKSEFDDLIGSSEDDSTDEEEDKKKKGKKKKKSKESEVKNFRKLLGLEDDKKSKKEDSDAAPSSGDDEEEDEDEELQLVLDKKSKKKKKVTGKKPPQSNDSEDDSSEEKEEELQLTPVKKNKKKKDKQSKATNMKPSKNIASEEEEDESEEEEQGMQLTWEPASNLQKLKKKKEKLTPWEEYQQKRKEKKRAKQRERKKEKLRQNGIEDTTDLGFDDPFFNDNEDDEGKKQKKKKKERRKKKREEGGNVEEEDEATQKEKAALGLLMKDDDDDLNHFSLEKIMREEKEAKKKKKGKKRKQGEMETADIDNFEVKLDHSRFSALYTNPEMHIDPNAPEFHKTKGMMSLMQEVSKRRKKNS